ncbi:MAG: hypothetical protein V7727_01290 [Sneathiella sp.]
MYSIVIKKHVISVLIILSVAFGVSLQSAAADQSSTKISKENPMSEASAEAFMRNWLTMIDTNAPLNEYLKYLPDGDFEQWSYPNAEIKNVKHLQQYFQKTWGMVKKNTNKINDLDATKIKGDRYQILTNVHWRGDIADGKSITKDLLYTLTVGEGTSAADPKGQYPKIYKYKISSP